MNKFPKIDELNLTKIPKLDSFPIGVFPEKLQEYINKSNEKFLHDKSFVGTAILTVYSTIIGKSLKIKTPLDWEMQPNVWSVLLGTSGTMKSPVINNAFKGISAANNEFIESFKNTKLNYNKDLARHKATPDNQNTPHPGSEPKRQHLILKDTTPEKQNEILAQEPFTIISKQQEMGAYFGRFSRYGGDKTSAIGAEIDTYDGELIDSARKTSEDSVAKNPYVCLIGGGQPELSIPEKVVDMGLANRFLYAFADDVVVQYSLNGSSNNWFDEYVEATKLHLFTMQMKYNKVEIDKETGIPITFTVTEIIEYDENAKQYWIDIANYYRAFAAKHANKLETPYLHKLINITDKIATILHTIYNLYSDNDPTKNNISINTLTNASTLALYYFNNFRYLITREQRKKEEDEMKNNIRWVAAYKHIVEGVKPSDLAIEFKKPIPTIYKWIAKNRPLIEQQIANN